MLYKNYFLSEVMTNSNTPIKIIIIIIISKQGVRTLHIYCSARFQTNSNLSLGTL